MVGGIHDHGFKRQVYINQESCITSHHVIFYLRHIGIFLWINLRYFQYLAYEPG
jgi:hypothetical protein